MTFRIDPRDVYKLEDGELARACRLIGRNADKLELPFDDFECSLLTGVPRFYANHGALTWRQRKAAREIITRTAEILIRRSIILAEDDGGDVVEAVGKDARVSLDDPESIRGLFTG